MRFNHIIPYSGETRTRTIFLLLPRTEWLPAQSRRDTRWLERATIMEQYSSNWSEWRFLCFMDNHPI